MNQYKIECEECDSVTHIFAYSKPEFCPMCGRRAEAELCEDDYQEELKAVLDF